jgi:hypothetical protein
MRSYQHAVVRGGVVGAVGVTVVGGAWEVPLVETRTRELLVRLDDVLPPHPDDGPHREPRGEFAIQRYATLVSTASGTNAAFTAVASERRDLRDLCVPVTYVSSGYVFGREYWITTSASS